MCGGLNVPPRIPTEAIRLWADVAVAGDDVLERAQLAHADRAARMQLLSRVADLRAHPELAAVGEARGCVDVHAGRVDPQLERASSGGVAGDDRLRMPGAVRVDVCDRVVDGVHDADGEDQRQELLAEV